MTTATLERDQKLLKVLDEVMKLYQYALTIKYEEQQRLILQYLQTLTKHHSEFIPVKEACDTVLEKFPDGMPHDSTLIYEAMRLVNLPYKVVFPQSPFEEDLLIFKMYDFIIMQIFEGIDMEEFDRKDQLIIEHLKRVVHNTFIEDPNLKGDNPYYKKNYSEMSKAKKMSLEYLNEEFKAYMDYFKTEE